MKRAVVHSYEFSVENEPFTILQVDESSFEDCFESDDKQSTFTLVMIDVSGSMEVYFNHLVTAWNENMAPILQGKTDIYVFGDSVYFRRTGVHLEERDFRCEGTNLTDAIYKIGDEINNHEENFIRIILITDGKHNTTSEKPESAINKLSVPSGKTVEFYLFGLGAWFPVECSIAIRSNLHNGNSNIPSLFWGNATIAFGIYDKEKLPHIIQGEIISISEYLKKRSLNLKLNITGYLAPGFDETCLVHCNEFISFHKELNKFSSDLKIYTEDNKEVLFEIVNEITEMRFFLNKIFRQWNSIIIQKHRKGGVISHSTFETMQKIFDEFHKKELDDAANCKPNSIQFRLIQKNIRFMETEYKTLMNQSKRIIGLEEKFASEIELAEGILKTTVKSKYDSKILRLKGQDNESFLEDMKSFKLLYEKMKTKILNLPEPSPDECCCVTSASTLKDLQDSNFLLLLNEDKFTFLKTFAITGIPIYAPVHDYSQINPWTLCIKNILKSPFSVVSQCCLELSADVNSVKSEVNKEIYLQKGNEDSKFNAVIPVYSQSVVKVLEPLLKNNIFAMLNTFCILKNPFVIDYNVHLAALGCAWLKSIKEYPEKHKRPEFLRNRIELIEATSKIYTKRKDISSYKEALKKEPSQALMTESSNLYSEKALKCESLVKPLFLLFLTLSSEHYSEDELKKIFSLLILEFIGRCISTTKEFPYSTHFSSELCTSEKRKTWLEYKMKVFCQPTLDSFIEKNGPLHLKYFKPEDFTLELRQHCLKLLKEQENQLFNIALDPKKVESLQNHSSAGDVRLNDLRIACEEFGLSSETIGDLFCQENLFSMHYHCMKHKTSKDRLSNEVIPYENAFAKVKTELSKENLYLLRIESTKVILENAVKIWTSHFLLIHESDTVKPMSEEEIIVNASQKSISVSHENFHKIFKYNSNTGLLRNACMIKGCPFYLQPNRTFNQHISIERTEGFLHQLHQITLGAARVGGKAEEVIDTILKTGYKSQNGLKIPAKPSKEKLFSFKDSVDNLIKDYTGFLGDPKLQN